MTARLVIVGTPGDKRTAALAAAAARQGVDARLVSWAAALADPRVVAAAGQAGDVLRVDSPGADGATWAALARLGGDTRPRERDEWRAGRGWFAGLTTFLHALDAHTTQLVPTHPTASILGMTDKRVCHERLAAAGVPVPALLAEVGSAGELRTQLDATGHDAVFVKPRWGSSGAGVLALRRQRGRELVVTTAELAGDQLINRKRLRRYQLRAEIDRLLDRVLGDGAIVQRWLPKLGVADGPLDLRVVVMRGRLALAVARVGRGAITNLHLDARRLDVAVVQERVGTVAFAALESACLRAAASFAGHHTVGVDVMLDTRGRPFVLECNAWGDYLPRLLSADGCDTYDLYLRDVFGARAMPQLLGAS